MGTLVAGGAIAFAMTGGSSQAGSRLREVAIHERVVLLPSGEAGVGGWCLTTLGGSEGGETGCKTGESAASGGPIVAEKPQSHIFVVGRGVPARTVIVLATSQVAAVSFEGYARVATHADVLLPDHMRGAVLELRGRMGEGQTGELALRALRMLDSIKIIAWSRDGNPIAGTMAKAPALTFGVPSRSWSRGQRVQRGVCGISVSGLDVSVQQGMVMTAVRAHRDVRGREFVNCARLDYWLARKWFIGADVLLDAAHPGETPARLPGILPLSGHSGTFVGAGAGGRELARRIPGAWLLVTQGKDLAQRLTLLEHLRATVHL
ncbi:MAG: hypothetical protein WBQ21_07425 [Solirubrobacteraceae bacterium]